MASNSSNPTAADIARATLRTPVRDSSARRYSANMQRLRDMFAKAGAPLNDPENKFCALDKRSPDCSPVSIAIELITARCGRVLNPENVDLGRNKGKSTGGDIRSSLRQLFRELDCRLCGEGRVCTHVQGEYKDHGEGAFSGNPASSPDLKVMIDRIVCEQARAKENLTDRACAVTHEDLSALYFAYCEPVALRVMNGEYPGTSSASNFDFNSFTAYTLNTLQFGAVARADEILLLDIEDLIFTGTYTYVSILIISALFMLFSVPSSRMVLRASQS